MKQSSHPIKEVRSLGEVSGLFRLCAGYGLQSQFDLSQANRKTAIARRNKRVVAIVCCS